MQGSEQIIYLDDEATENSEMIELRGKIVCQILKLQGMSKDDQEDDC